MKSNHVVALATALMLAGFAGDALAAKKSSSSGAPSAEQRKKLYKEGLASCRKKYGSRLHEVHIEKYYGRWATVCYVY